MILQLILGFYPPYIKAMELFSFGSETFFASNIHVVECRWKFYKLSEPTGSDFESCQIYIYIYICGVIQKDGLNFIRLYFLNYIRYVNDLCKS